MNYLKAFKKEAMRFINPRQMAIIEKAAKKSISKNSPTSSEVHVPSTGKEDRVLRKGGPGSGPTGQKKQPHLQTVRPDKGYGAILTVGKSVDDSPDVYPNLNNDRVDVLKDESENPDAYEMQSIVEGMDWELSNGVNDPATAREVVMAQLDQDPNHYRKLMFKDDGTDDVLAKDTQENEEDPFAGEGYNLDLGSGTTRESGYLGLDLYPYDYGTIIHDLHQGLPFDDGTVKNVRMVNSLHTMDELSKDPKPLLSEIHRVMMPGGQFIYEGPNDIYNEPEWTQDYPGFVLTHAEDGEVNKSNDQIHRQTFTRIAVPDPATANGAEPRTGVAQYDQLPSDTLLAINALDYYFSDSTSSGKLNRIHGYPSQGALMKTEDPEEMMSPTDIAVHAALNPKNPNPAPPKKPARKMKRVAIMKADQAKQIVYGVVLVPGEIDSQDEWMTAEDIEKAAHSYLKNSRVIGSQHSKPILAEPVESYIAPQDLEWDGQYGPQSVKQGSWVLGVKINDPAEWQKVIDGEYTGFSVGGFGSRD